jgi:16S rRNA G1207 methylase RsmC
MDYQRLCEQIFALHDDIRYAAVVDDSGLLIAGGMRKGIDSIVDQNNEELYLAQTALRKSMRQRFDATMGKSRFAYVEREKISILTIYMNKNTVIVTTEPNVDSHTAIDIAQDALELLDENAETTQQGSR